MNDSQPVDDRPYPPYVHRTPRYHPRAQFGIRAAITTCCAYCGDFTRTVMSERRFITNPCVGRYIEPATGYDQRCATRFVIGFRFAPVPMGSYSVLPPDYVLPAGLRDAFPTGDLFRWQSRYPAHVLAGGGLTERVQVDDGRAELVAEVLAHASSIEDKWSPAVALGKAFVAVCRERGLM